LANGVEILEALEDGLAEFDGITTRIGDAVAGNVAVLTEVGLACEKRGAEGRLKCRGGLIAGLNIAPASANNIGFLVLEARVARGADVGTQSGDGDRNLLVGGA
jgi:hypothetical protein